MNTWTIEIFVPFDSISDFLSDDDYAQYHDVETVKVELKFTYQPVDKESGISEPYMIFNSWSCPDKTPSPLVYAVGCYLSSDKVQDEYGRLALADRAAYYESLKYENHNYGQHN